MNKLSAGVLSAALAACVTPHTTPKAETSALTQKATPEEPTAKQATPFIPPSLPKLVHFLIERCGALQSEPVLMEGRNGGVEIDPSRWAFADVPYPSSTADCLEKAIGEVGSPETGHCFAEVFGSNIPGRIHVILGCEYTVE